MAEELRELRLSRKLSAKEMIEVVRERYPKYDKVMQSKCERGDEYGIQLKTDAMNALLVRFAPKLVEASKKRRGGRHRYTRRIACRLPDDRFDLLQQHIKADGYETTQDWLSYIVSQYLHSKETPQTEEDDE